MPRDVAFLSINIMALFISTAGEPRKNVSLKDSSTDLQAQRIKTDLGSGTQKAEVRAERKTLSAA